MVNRADVTQITGHINDVIGKLMTAAETAGAKNGHECLHFLTKPSGQKTLAKIGEILADVQEKSLDHITVELRPLSHSIAMCQFDSVDLGLELLFTEPFLKQQSVGPADIVTITAGITFTATIERLERQGRRPATLAELLAQNRNPVNVREGATFALGTVAITPNGSFVCYVHAGYDDDELALLVGGDKLPPPKRHLKMIKVGDISDVSHVVGDDTWVLAVRK